MLKYLIVPLTLLAAACGPIEQSAEQQRTQQVKTQMKAAVRQVPPPKIQNFQELRWATYLYELRDQTFGTYSYYTDLNGNLHFICESVGFGINASVQITNPERIISHTHQSFGTIPQPEPNALYMPEGLAATYVLCAAENTPLGVAPIYIEDNVIVSVFPLKHKGSIQE